MWHAWGERRGACMVLVVEPEGKRSLRKARLSWDYNITLDRRRRGLGRRELSWFHSEQGRVVSACECSNELSGPIKCGELLEYLRNYILIVSDLDPWSESVFSARGSERCNWWSQVITADYLAEMSKCSLRFPVFEIHFETFFFFSKMCLYKLVTNHHAQFGCRSVQCVGKLPMYIGESYWGQCVCTCTASGTVPSCLARRFRGIK